MNGWIKLGLAILPLNFTTYLRLSFTQKPVMPPFKLIIFDCDGVLVDSEGIATQVFIDMLAELGVDITLEEVMNHYVGMPMPDGLALLAKQYGFTPQQILWNAFTVTAWLS